MKKIFMLLMCTASINSFGLSSPSSLLKLDPNQDGYKIKFMADLTNIKPNNEWFPEFYNYETKSENDEYSPVEVTTKDNKVYRLVNFKRYDKYKNTLSGDSLLNLCYATLDGKSNWRCDAIGDGKNPDNQATHFVQSSDSDQLVMYSSVLKPKNLIFYNSNTKAFTYEEFPKSFYGYSIAPDSLDNYAYYANGIFYNRGKYFDFVNKSMYEHAYGSVYSIQGNCFRSEEIYSLGGKYYTFDSGSLFNVDFSTKYFFTSGEQVGDRNAALSSLGMLSNQAVRANGKLFFLAEDKDNIPPQGKIYYISETANKNTEWKTLTIKSTSSDYYAQSFQSLRLYFTDNRVFFTILAHTGTLNNGRSSRYLYEIIK